MTAQSVRLSAAESALDPAVLSAEKFGWPGQSSRLRR